MVRVTLDMSKVVDSESFHTLFAETFGFPDYYGRNMDAWIDCMSDLGDPDTGMTSIRCDEGDFVLLELNGMNGFKERCPRLYEDLLECAAYVNWRNVEAGDSPPLMLAFLE